MGFFSSSRSPASNNGKKKLSKKRIRFTDDTDLVKRHEYDFDWELEPEYWYSRVELKSFNEVRFDDADVLRKERGIRTASRNDADELTTSKRNLFIGDKITHALDDEDDEAHDISLRGIEHFVFPVLQKEMVRRKKDLKGTVLAYSRDPMARRRDPKGIKLAEQSAVHSQWARDVATERGIKYCEMKRGGGRGGGLLSQTKRMNMNKNSHSLNLGKGRPKFQLDLEVLDDDE